MSVVLFGALDLAFDFADGREVLVQLALICRPEVAFELPRVFGHEVKDRTAELVAAGTVLRAQTGVGAEQAFEHGPWIEHRRQRLGLAAPGQIVGVRTGVAGVAIAGLTGVLHAELERREARIVADLVGDDLVARDAAMDVGHRLLGLDSGQIRSAAAAVVAGAVEQGASIVVREVAEDGDVVAHGLERLHDARERAEFAFVVDLPVPDVHAVGHVDESHTDWGLHRRGEGGCHRIEHGQRDGCAEAAQEGAAGKEFGRHLCSCAVAVAARSRTVAVLICSRVGGGAEGVVLDATAASPRRDWKGRLFAISKTSDWNP